MTYIVNVSPRVALIHPNKPPSPFKSLVMYLNNELPGPIYSDSTVIVTGVSTHLVSTRVAVGVGVGV